MDFHSNASNKEVTWRGWGALILFFFSGSHILLETMHVLSIAYSTSYNCVKEKTYDAMGSSQAFLLADHEGKGWAHMKKSAIWDGHVWNAHVFPTLPSCRG